jgi:short-subunit dehydrogenase
MKVYNKVIVVTGGGNGMGRELTLNLLAKGAKVVAVDINESALQETIKLAEDKKESLSILVADITRKELVEKLLEEALQIHGHIDGLINNAGIVQSFLRLNDLGFDTIERVMNVNFYGTLYMTKASISHLLTRPEAHIVNISSMGGFLPVPGQIIYGASKAAIKLLTEGLALELLETNVKVSVVFPGALRTNIKANSGLGREAGLTPENAPENMALSPQKAAQMIVEGMEANQKRIYIGSDSRMMNIMYKLRPDFATQLIYKKIKHKM